MLFNYYLRIESVYSSTKEGYILAIKMPRHWGRDLVTKVIGWPITTLLVSLGFMVETNIIELKDNQTIY